MIPFRPLIVWLVFLGGLVIQTGQADQVRAMSLNQAKSWGYWLQNAEIEVLAAHDFDLYVIDYSRDGQDQGAYTPSEIGRLKAAGKIVLAYFSIGEAEDYRFYWDQTWSPGDPSWLGPENPDWAGNYKVKYWEEDWWTTALVPYLERILAAGFDGVYLDIIDAYYYWGENGYDEETCANQMVALVQRIAAYARTRAGAGFIVCPQNGLSLYDDATDNNKTIYLDTIDCVGLEDVFFNSTPADKAYRLGLFPIFLNAGKKLFSIEYIAQPLYDQYIGEAKSASPKVIPYAANPDRELDSLNSAWLDFFIPQKTWPGPAALLLEE